MSFSIFPKIVYKARSEISDKIVVKEQLGQLTLEVGGIIQSGGIVRGIWKKALRLALLAQGKPSLNNYLVLGLGGGTAVHLIKNFWPGAKITAIEIDPEIIKIGKQYFGLGKLIENGDLEIITADAFKWTYSCISELIHCNSYDLIIVDLYLGKKYPPEAESEKFIKSVDELLAKNGLVIFNRLKTDETKNFEDWLERYFSSVNKIKTPTNYLFLAGK